MRSRNASTSLHTHNHAFTDRTMETLETTNGVTSKRPIADIIGDLKKPLPQRLLKTRRQGGTELTYIEWFTAVETLDFYTNCNWSGEVTKLDQIGNRVVVTYRITIHAIEGDYYREATGSEYTDEDVPASPSFPGYDQKKAWLKSEEGQEYTRVCKTKFQGYGEPCTNAEAQAFKRAAAKFGLTLDLYKK